MLHLQKCVKVHFHWRMTSFKFNTIWNEICCDKQKHKAGLRVAQARDGQGHEERHRTHSPDDTKIPRKRRRDCCRSKPQMCFLVVRCIHTKNNTKLAPTALVMVSPLKPWLQSVVDSDSRRRHGRLVSPVSFLHFHQLGCKRSWCIGNSHRNLQARPRDDVYVTQTLADGQSFNISRRAGDLLGAVVLATSTLSESRRCCRMEVKQVKRPLQK